MKTTYKILLAIAIIGLAYVCVRSIMGPISFKKEKTSREKQIIARLIDVRKAQIAYKSVNNRHAANFDELIEWLNTGNIPSIRKVGELSETQLENGMTEQKAVDIIKKAEATGKWADAEKEGLSQIINGQRVSFTRDTTWNNAKVTLFGENYDVNQLRQVPGTNETIDMDTASVTTGSGYNIKIFQASVPYEKYLSDLDQRELRNLIEVDEKVGRFPGLKVGSLTEVNNNAGNWE